MNGPGLWHVLMYLPLFADEGTSSEKVGNVPQASQP